MILKTVLVAVLVVSVCGQEKKKEGEQQTRYGGRPVRPGGGFTHSSAAGQFGPGGFVGGRPVTGHVAATSGFGGRPHAGVGQVSPPLLGPNQHGLGGAGLGNVHGAGVGVGGGAYNPGLVGQQGVVGGAFGGRPGVVGGGFVGQHGVVGGGLAGQHGVVGGGLAGQHGVVGGGYVQQPGLVGQQGLVNPGIATGGLAQGGLIGQGIGGPTSYDCAARVSTLVNNKNCKNYCKAPQKFFGGKYLCCDVAPGQCPPVRPTCPDLRFGGPLCCIFDSQCAPTQKCCFDQCLKHKVCKAAIY